jgi:hypothetical protein
MLKINPIENYLNEKVDDLRTALEELRSENQSLNIQLQILRSEKEHYKQRQISFSDLAHLQFLQRQHNINAQDLVPWVQSLIEEIKILRMQSGALPVMQINSGATALGNVIQGYEHRIKDGLSLSDNPYASSNDGMLIHSWEIGWRWGEATYRSEKAIQFEIDKDRKLKVEKKNDDPEAWIVTVAENRILNKNNEWEVLTTLADITDSADRDQFINRTRFPTLDTALQASLNAPNLDISE